MYKLKIYNLSQGTMQTIAVYCTLSCLVLVSVLGKRRVSKIAAGMVPCSLLLAVTRKMSYGERFGSVLGLEVFCRVMQRVIILCA